MIGEIESADPLPSETSLPLKLCLDLKTTPSLDQFAFSGVKGESGK